MITQWTSSDYQTITNGKWHGLPPQGGARQSIEFDHRCLDKDGLFLALQGDARNGHEFVSQLDDAQWALVEKIDETASAAQLVVDDVLGALGKLAQKAMSQTKARKIAVTGSVGKTGTKEALAHCLSSFGITHYSTGSFNNHLGAPLSMARTPEGAEFVITEMGMNHAGEITPLSQLFNADIAIITKIAASHIGFFSSTDDIAAAKAEIFDGMTSGTAILPYDDDYFDYLCQRAQAKGLKIISFGANKGADIYLENQALTADGQNLSLRLLDGSIIEITTGLHAAHYASTVMIVTAILQELELDIHKALAAFASLSEMKGRGNQQDIHLSDEQACLMIDDSYNAGPASMKASLHYASHLSHKRKGLILTDMLELGEMSKQAHKDLVPLIKELNPDCLILSGPYMSSLAPQFEGICQIYCGETAKDMTQNAAEIMRDCDLILIKGSHGSGAHLFASHFLETSRQMTVKGGL